jgi:L-asparaginase/Glu-tRNA(Gln) amidotransferase subunit D
MERKVGNRFLAALELAILRSMEPPCLYHFPPDRSYPEAVKSNAVILATGGTIAGAGASDLNSATYAAAKVPGEV